MSMGNGTKVGNFKTLLSAFRKVPETSGPTFLEITRYPHYENVCSNILEFFLDPKKPHGLGTLFLDAIASLCSIENQQGIRSNVEVTREVKTEAGNYIDILVRSDTHAVLIENKIWHTKDNPSDDYAEHLGSLVQPYKHKLLLTLKPDGDTAREWGFKNVTHEQLVYKVRELLGAYIAAADTRYLTFMLDFLKTLDNLREGMAMDPEFLEFAKSNQPDIESLVAQVRKFRNELRGKIIQLEEMADLSNHSKVSWDRYREQEEMWDSLVHTIEFEENFKVCIQTWVSPEGWGMGIWLMPETTKRARLPELLRRQGIPYEVKDGGISHKKCLEYDADLKDVADLLQDVVAKVADARSSGYY